MQGAIEAASPGAAGAWRAVLAGLCGILVGIGLARFAYTPLLPALIEAGWFDKAAAAYLGAANLAGYLAGALLARPLAALAPVRSILRAMLLLACASFFACAAPLPFLWFFLWRFASGLAGGVLMVLGATAVLAQVPVARRGVASGIMFGSVGFGMVASGTLVPFLMQAGLSETWIGLGVLALLLTVAGWRGWPDAPVQRAGAVPLPRAHSGALKLLYVQYALGAVGLVPHMVFLVDFIARGLGQGLASGSLHWVLFGLGAMLGPVLTGHLSDRIGPGRALRLTFAVQAAAILIPVVATGAPALFLSSLIVGAFVPGIVPPVLGRVQALVSNDRARQAAWGVATAAFALGQAGAAYFFSYLFAQGGGYGLLFGLGGGAVLLALALDFAAPPVSRRP